MNNKFSITINDDDGNLSLDIVDFMTNTRASITQEDIGLQKVSGLSIFGLSKLIINYLKPQFRQVVANDERV